MFGLLAAIFAGVGLIMSLSGTEVKPWILWAVLLCIALSTLVGPWWPMGSARFGNRRVGS